MTQTWDPRQYAAIRQALIAELDARGFDGASASPWFSPEPDAYRARLERAGFVVRLIVLLRGQRRSRTA
jgi:hypothetical protein